jgi:hypothetical protein
MGTQCSGTAKVYFPSSLVHFTDIFPKEQHPREYGGAVYKSNATLNQLLKTETKTILKTKYAPMSV